MTPVDVDKYEQLLIESNYPREKRDYLISGFCEGFNLQYHRDKHVRRTANNLRLYVGYKTILWNKVMKEVREKRFAGPPFEYYIQSPVGLVPKDSGSDTRLIFHLSHPRSDPSKSVNGCIPKELCTVTYSDFNQAVRLCMEAGIGCRIGKSDMKSAFRHICMRVADFCWLLMVAESPLDGKNYFFVDKCLSFGSSISCKIFQDFSDSVAWLVKFQTRKNLVNYLDDYFFAALLAASCNQQINKFLEICEKIKFPVALDKTFWATTLLVFLGLLINTKTQTVSIPVDKIERAKDLVLAVIKKKKTTVLTLQQLTGFLNFLCRVVVPGCTFMRRIYSQFNSELKLHYHMRVTKEMKEDLQMWLSFLNHPSSYCRSFIDFRETLEADEIFLRCIRDDWLWRNMR